MSFVLDQVRRIDAQLDRVVTTRADANEDADGRDAGEQEDGVSTAETRRVGDTPRILALQAAVRKFSSSAGEGRGLIKVGGIQSALREVGGQSSVGTTSEEKKEGGSYEEELEWLLVSKATTQVYGHVLERILGQAVALSEDLWYWDEVLSSRTWTAVYGVQSAPGRVWEFGGKVVGDVRAKMVPGEFRMRGQEGIEAGWREFYGLVRQVVRDRSVKEVQKQLVAPVTRVRGEVRRKQEALRRVRVRNANALGVLLGEGLANESVHGEGLASSAPSSETSAEGTQRQDLQHKWRASVARNVALMEAVLVKINDAETPVEKFDTAVGELTDDDPLFAVESADLTLPAQAVAERLSRVLTLGLSQYTASTTMAVQQHGKPSKMVRYWLPVAVGVLSSSTILRVLVHRQAEVVQWIQDLGATVVDFWQNWVLEPTRNLIRTIRHDEGSEISIMSKRSLEGDRESLERMVVDFAIDNPANTTGSGSSLTETEIADLRAKVREGDVTPVLKAYEKDLTSPLMGAVRGNLIRALLIQIQKTKVDVEVAMGGIDSLLKSQELLIGFISLTPGLLVAYGVTHYIRSSLSSKRGVKAQRKQGKMLRQLRNIDRILTAAQPTEYGELLYKDQGLLICEVHVLREAARKVMPGEIWREFSEEAEELCDVRMGVERQKAVASRVRWAYGRWLG